MNNRDIIASQCRARNRQATTVSYLVCETFPAGSTASIYLIQKKLIQSPWEAKPSSCFELRAEFTRVTFYYHQWIYTSWRGQDMMKTWVFSFSLKELDVNSANEKQATHRQDWDFYSLPLELKSRVIVQCFYPSSRALTCKDYILEWISTKRSDEELTKTASMSLQAQ